jgi:membrane-bound lytic murein transglycosylase B
LTRPPPLPFARVFRRLRAGGLSLLVLLLWSVVAAGLLGGTMASGRPSPGPQPADAAAGAAQGVDWASLLDDAWLRGRAAAAEAERDRAAVAQAAGGAGATVTSTSWTTPAGGDRAIPALALRAYREAEAWASGFTPGCQLSWSVLAGIGRIESNHGMHGGAATRFSPGGVVSPAITGPPLDGRGVARIADTDGGRWDGDTTWDRAVGPMQFIPTTWRSLGRDGNGDRVADPNNLFDAAVSAAAYLCLSVDGSLADQGRLRQAIFAYNHSWAYVDAVLGWASFYRGGVTVGPSVPSGSAAPGTSAASGTSRATRPPTTRARATTSSRATTTTGRATTTSGSTTSTTGATTTTAPCQTTTTTTSGSTTTTTTTTTTSSTTTTTLPPC